jgi:hypothetical protein
MSKVKPLLGFPLCGLPHKFKIQRAKCKIKEGPPLRGKQVMAALRPFRNFDFLFLTFALLLAGCAETQRYEAAEQILTEDIDKVQAMQIAEDVLAKMRFTIEKADVESGLIRTRPLPGAQFFEIWRSDNVGSFNCAEANLNSIRRIAELNIKQQDEGLSIGCDVTVYRLSLPERQVSSSTRAYEMFSESSSLLQVIRLNPEQKAGMAWVNLGRDRRLEAEILKRISSMLDIEYQESSIE